MCMSGDYSLTFTSPAYIPFAVRLVEVQLSAGVPTIKYGTFKFPSSLGSSDTERMTAVLDKEPLLQEIERRERK